MGLGAHEVADVAQLHPDGDAPGHPAELAPTRRFFLRHKPGADARLLLRRAGAVVRGRNHLQKEGSDGESGSGVPRPGVVTCRKCSSSSRGVFHSTCLPLAPRQASAYSVGVGDATPMMLSVLPQSRCWTQDATPDLIRSREVRGGGK